MKKPAKSGSKRVKRFEDGGLYSGDDEIVKYRMGQLKDPGVDLFKLARGEEQVAKPIPLDKKPETTEIKKETKTVTTPIIEAGAEEETNVRSKPIVPPKKQSFGEAFKSARTGGEKTFTFNGKSYTTELAKPKAKEPAYNAAAAEESYASSMEKSNPDYRAVMKRLNSPEFKLAKESGAIKGNPFEDFEREDRIIKNQRSLMGKKKGGTVKKMASGGGVRSASARADGCAIRGKTRA